MAAATVLIGASAIVTFAAPAPLFAEAHQANPFVGATQYRNSLWQASVETEAAKQSGSLASAMRTVKQQPTAIWLDRIAAIAGPSGGMGLAAHLDAALSQGANLITIVVYDLPGRDCNALASNGELPATAAGLTRYKTEYIDPIATILSNTKYANLRIVAIIEPDSLPNIVTNPNVAACATAGPFYEQGITYALDKLHAISNVYNYLDMAHSGWLGWTSNSGPAASEFAKVANMTSAKMASIDGFISDTANTTPLVEPYMTATQSINGQQVMSAQFYEYNPDLDEASFTADMFSRLVSAGFPSSIGMLIDTSRNGWGGSARPSGPSTSTDLNTFVNATRVDRRNHRGAWCNPSGAGIGAFPQATPGGYSNSHLDAFVWIKPPGESDGASTDIPNNEGKKFDRMCDPTYAPSGSWNGKLTGALPNAPLSGQWFSAQFIQLVQNAYPAIGSTPTGTPTRTASASATRTGSATPTRTGTATATATRSGSATPTRTGATPSRTATPTATRTGATPTRTASGTAGGAARCSATFAYSSQWGGGFTANVTVTNTGSVATKTWTVTWTWNGTQKFVNSWNAVITQSGTAVTAKNQSYNNVIAAGGNTSFGMQVSYTGTVTAPTLTCSAT